MGCIQTVYILATLICYHFSLIPFTFADLMSLRASSSSDSGSEENDDSSVSSSSAPFDVSTAPSITDIHASLSAPFVASWRKIPAASCTLTSDYAESWGPFPALLTLNHREDIVAFEPVSINQLCPLQGNRRETSNALYHVVCADNEGGPPGGPSAVEGVIGRPAPDLTYRLSLESINVPGLLPRLLAASLRTFVAGI